jgi:hypothetical protein
MGSAWYRRAEVVALRDEEQLEARAQAGAATVGPAGARRRTDAELIAYLRRPAPTPASLPPDMAGGAIDPMGRPRAPTAADLVADMGVSIARAQKVYRFWLTHDAHPLAEVVRAGGGGGARPRGLGAAAAAPVSSSKSNEAGSDSARPAERRGSERLARASLIRQLRSPDPAARAAAFLALKKPPRSADGS